MRSISKYNFAALIYFLFALQPILAYQVYLNAKAILPPGPVLLKDIARVEGDAGNTTIIELGREPVFIDKTMLDKSLAGHSPTKIFGSGLWVIPNVGHTKDSQLHKQLLDEMAGLPGASEISQYKIRLNETSILPIAPEKTWLRFRLPNRLYRPGQYILPVDLVRRNEFQREETLLRSTISFKVLKEENVAIALRDIEPHSILQEGDFRVEKREFDTEKHGYFVMDPKGKRAVDRIGKGEVIRQSVLQEALSVRRGQVVTLVYQGPGLVLQMRTTAMADGKAGDIISLKPLLQERKTADIRKGRIISDGLAEFISE